MLIDGFELVVRAVVRDGGRVLLAHPAEGSWYFLPGGHVDPGESAPAALRRELQEELGVQARVGDLVAVIENRYSDDRGDHHELSLVHEVSTIGVDATSKESHLGFRWFHEEDLTDLDIRPAPIAGVLRGGLGGPRLPLMSDGLERG